MKQILFLLLNTFFFVCAGTQSNYTQAMQQGDDAFKNGKYKTTINKYFAAEAFDPSKKEIVKEKVNNVFDRIQTFLPLQVFRKKKHSVVDVFLHQRHE